MRGELISRLLRRIDRFDYEEQHQRYQQEVDNRGNKFPIEQSGAVDGHGQRIKILSSDESQ